MTSPLRRVAAAAVTLLLAGGALVVSAPGAHAACPNVFDAQFVARLAARHPGVRLTASVYDTRTGCWSHINPGLEVTTASVIKAQVLGAVLLKAQDEGRGLTAWERARIHPMIAYSDNPTTGALYGHVGGAAGMEATDSRLGAAGTSHTATFGLTRSTAVDRTMVSLRLLHGGGALATAGRAEAWSYMSAVHPLQEWGISAGVPAGWSVAQKNGFYPSTGLGWRVGSTGFVRHDASGQGYAITVMTELAPNQPAGIRAVEEVARRAAAALSDGPGLDRPIDRARCVVTSSGESWSGVAARLGLPAGRAGDVRLTSGNNDRPLGGQQACSPDIPGPVAYARASVGGTYRVVASDLTCDGRDDVIWYAPGSAADYLWRGERARGFLQSPIAIGGDYVPIAGDFDGDGCGDILWYGRGPVADSIWYGGSHVEKRPLSITGATYRPVSGDLDGDGRDDVVWYGPGGAPDSIWYGRAQRGRFDDHRVTIGGSYTPVVADLDGNGADEVVWYGPGSHPDYLWRGVRGGRNPSGTNLAAIGGTYRPIAGDFDDDGRDEVIWYAPGSRPDYRWDGMPPGQISRPLAIGGDYMVAAGDFNGDLSDDILWFGPGAATDSVWWGRPGDVDLNPTPLLRR